jgi:hypothetical protein
MPEALPFRKQVDPVHAPAQEEVEASFRDSLSDLLALLKALAPSCPSTADLANVVKIGTEDDSQLRFLLGLLQNIPQDRKR